MAAGIAILIAAAQTIYVAKLDSFGCTSTETVSNLQTIRTQEKSFQSDLYQKIFQGECTLIIKNTLVEGSLFEHDPSMMLVNRAVQPPGYLAPSNDFEIKGKTKEAHP